MQTPSESQYQGWSETPFKSKGTDSVSWRQLNRYHRRAALGLEVAEDQVTTWTSTGKGKGSLHEKLICLVRGEEAWSCEAEGEAKLTGDADK